MSDRESVAEFLESAADILDRDGWVQHQGGGPAIGWCAVGALVCRMDTHSWGDPLDKLTHNRDVFLLSVSALAARVRETEQLPASFADRYCPQSVVEWWNDRPDRTRDDVTTALRKVAITVREQVQP